MDIKLSSSSSFLEDKSAAPSWSEKCEETALQNDFNTIEIPCNSLTCLSASDLNVQSLCRICLSENGAKMYSMVGPQSKDSELLNDMFTSITTITVHPNDGLPSNICETCKLQLTNCWNFKDKCLKTDFMLKSLLKGEFTPKEETCKVEPISGKSAKGPLENSLNYFENVKEENDFLTEDIQYLEDLSDEEVLSVVRNVAKSENKQQETVHTESNKETQQPKKRNKSNVCSFCFKRYRNSKQLNVHIKRKHSNADLPHACTHCSETFSSDQDLNLHLPLHSKGPVWTCFGCNKEFRARTKFRRHLARHLSVKKWSCSVCNKPFTELYALRRHSRTHTGERPAKTHACHFCDKRFSVASHLQSHLSRHTGDRPCVCDVCGKRFPSTRLLASHRLVHSDDKPYQCQYCDKRFRHESTRNTHHRTHTGEKPYVCSTCGKTFIQNSNLTLHMRTHTGERPYKCETCGRQFSSGSSLKNHTRIHTGEKPFGCDVCGKRFARIDVRAHMRVHTGERPFECGACRRRFVTAARLKDHARIHTGEKPFECDACKLKFTTKSQVVKHMKKHKCKRPQNHEETQPSLFKSQKHDETRPSLFTQKNEIRRSVLKTQNDEVNRQGVFYFTHNGEECEQIVVDKEIETRTSDTSTPIIVNEQIELDDDENRQVLHEYVVHDESNGKSELLVVEDSQSSYQNGALCLTTDGVNYVTNEYPESYNNVNLVTVNEGEMRMIEGSTVKLYQLDQSLVQIHSSGGQVTISKITSKMTANF